MTEANEPRYWTLDDDDGTPLNAMRMLTPLDYELYQGGGRWEPLAPMEGYRIMSSDATPIDASALPQVLVKIDMRLSIGRIGNKP